MLLSLLSISDCLLLVYRKTNVFFFSLYIVFMSCILIKLNYVLVLIVTLIIIIFLRLDFLPRR